jgi:uncharacterized membrane protein YjjB (DUF3815 family)
VLVQIPGLITLVPGSMGFRGLLLADNLMPLIFQRKSPRS